MARMLPAVCDGLTRSRGEREIFARLRDDPATESWTILHSLDIAKPVYRVAAEADFVLLIPGLGILCLEVKATNHLRREAGLWYYGDDPNGDPRGPFKQAADAMYSLRQTVHTRAPRLSRIVWWSAVAIPYLSFTERSSEWTDWQVIDRKAYTGGMARSCARVLVHAREFLATVASARWFDPDSGAPSVADCAEIAELLRPRFDVLMTPKARRNERDEELRRYTEDQFEALDAMEANPRVLVEGPAGTGKTLLAIECARRASIRGDRVLLSCYNKLIGGHISNAVQSLSGVRAGTLHSIMLGLTNLAGDDLSHKPSEFWSHELPERASLAVLESGEPTFDQVVIDEAQDLMAEPYLDFLDCCLEGGLTAGKWRFFGDFERQSLFGNPAPVLAGLLATRAPSTSRYALRTNCRNGPEIASLSGMLASLRPPYTRILRSRTGLEPQLSYYTSRTGQEELLRTSISLLLEEGYQPGEVVILSPRIDGVARHVQSPPWQWQELDGSQPGAVRRGTIHAFKGMECGCVIVTDIGDVGTEWAQSLFYTAATRALDRLTILLPTTARASILRILTEAPIDGAVAT